MQEIWGTHSGPHAAGDSEPIPARGPSSLGCFSLKATSSSHIKLWRCADRFSLLWFLRGSLLPRETRGAL
jgi:hypothetical protein